MIIYQHLCSFFEISIVFLALPTILLRKDIGMLIRYRIRK
ncbi:hypothetical protein HMPREF0653_02481 [Prevotella disiens JCM 6334 = ATCC 29426]|uniref:Uncharacterized protein n=1 Tax=Prevotella disiens JCM 6334 = ATCC 29426 TaxID=1235811 RepID=A0ABN0NP65_9BACT|nr:hypothetical protein HMPREF0653_02481 [Prevotella disiens JCM 6334 = ATCC 29426]